MFPSLAAAIEELDPPVDGSSLGELLRLRDRLDAKIAIGVGQFDRDGSWALDDASSATAWLRQHAGLSGPAAASLTRTGKVVLGAPVLAAAWLDGSVSGGQVQAVVANVNDRVAGLFAEHEGEMVPRLAALNVRETAIVMQAWRDRADALLEDDLGKDEPKRSLHLSRTLDGRAELKGSFDAEAAAPIEAALRVASVDDSEGESRSPAERRADALRDVCQWFLDHQDTATTVGRHRPHVNLVLTLEELEARSGGHTLDGTLLDADAIRVLLCDANLNRVITDGRGTILDYGRSTRTIPPALFSALALRDGHCRMVEGCDRPPDWCDAHHIVPWEEGGATNLQNLVLACSHHHHLAHRKRWRQTLERDGTLTIETPDDRGWTTYPAGALTFGYRAAS